MQYALSVSNYRSKSITLSRIIRTQMEGRKTVLFIQSYFKHVYTLFVEIQQGKHEQTSVCLGIVLYCCRTSGHTYLYLVTAWSQHPDTINFSSFYFWSLAKLHTCTASLSSFYFWSLAYIHVLLPSLPSISVFRSLAYMYCFPPYLLLLITCIHALLPALPSIRY